jgi:hypothetical protein
MIMTCAIRRHKGVSDEVKREDERITTGLLVKEESGWFVGRLKGRAMLCETARRTVCATHAVQAIDAARAAGRPNG